MANEAFDMTYKKWVYYVGIGSTVRVNVQNASPGRFEMEPLYETQQGIIEPEEKFLLDPGESSELPYPLQKEEGEAPDEWHLCYADTHTPIMKLVFKLP